MINYSRHRKAIEKLYDSTCTISRYVKGKKASSETRLGPAPEIVCADQPCRLSQKALASNGQTEVQNDIVYETKLFIAPDIPIIQGDTIMVTRYGVTQSYTAGEPFIYPTHQEISLRREGKA